MILTHTDYLPDPRSHERNGYNRQPNKSAGLSLPRLVIEDVLQCIATGNLKTDRDEGKKASGP